MTAPARHPPLATLAVLLAADTVVFCLACLLGTAAATRVRGLGDAVEAAAALFWMAAAFGLALLAWALVGRLPWARLGHGLAYFALAAGAVEWMTPGFPFGALAAAQVACFALALLSMTAGLRAWTPPAVKSPFA